MSDKNFPSYYYGPNGEGQIFEKKEDVPSGWKDTPASFKQKDGVKVEDKTPESVEKVVLQKTSEGYPPENITAQKAKEAQEEETAVGNRGLDEIKAQEERDKARKKEESEREAREREEARKRNFEKESALLATKRKAEKEADEQVKRQQGNKGNNPSTTTTSGNPAETGVVKTPGPDAPKRAGKRVE